VAIRTNDVLLACSASSALIGVQAIQHESRRDVSSLTEPLLLIHPIHNFLQGKYTRQEHAKHAKHRPATLMPLLLSARSRKKNAAYALAFYTPATAHTFRAA
jgi:hypothetical protein